MPSLLSADILIHQHNGTLVAAIEVKNREGLNAEVAATLRRNLMLHGAIPDVKYFVLLSQERGFVWVNRNGFDREAPPAAEFSVDGVLRRYFPSNFRGRLRGSELQSLVFAWLSDLSQYGGPPRDEAERALAELGFVEAIRGGGLMQEAA